MIEQVRLEYGRKGQKRLRWITLGQESIGQLRIWKAKEHFGVPQQLFMPQVFRDCKKVGNH